MSLMGYFWIKTQINVINNEKLYNLLTLVQHRAKKKEAEKDEPQRRAAYARCRSCIHERSCDIRVKQQFGTCGGYTPKEKKNPFL